MITQEKKSAYYIFVGFAIYAIVLFIYGDQISLWSSNDTTPLWQSWLVYFYSSPLVIGGILLGGYIGKKKGKELQGLIAGNLILYATDLSSLPKSLFASCPLQIPTIPQLSLFSDTILAKFISPYVNSSVCIANYSLLSVLIYAVIPISLFYISMRLLGYKLFVREIRNNM